jgi:hypothetical protein
MNSGLGFWESHNRRPKLEEGEDKIPVPALSKDVIKKLTTLLPLACRDGLPETQDGRYFLVDFDMIREVINSAPPKVRFRFSRVAR